MQDNIKKVAERGERLDSLQDKTGECLTRQKYSEVSEKHVSLIPALLYSYTDTLAVSAQGFRRGANRVRKAMWWKVCQSCGQEF